MNLLLNSHLTPRHLDTCLARVQVAWCLLVVFKVVSSSDTDKNSATSIHSGFLQILCLTIVSQSSLAMICILRFRDVRSLNAASIRSRHLDCFQKVRAKAP